MIAADPSKQALAKLAVVLLWLEERDGCGLCIPTHYAREAAARWEREDDGARIREALDEAEKLYRWLHEAER